MPPFLEGHPVLAILAIWLVASAIFVGVPVALTFGALYRRAKREGVANARAVITRRLFVPGRARGPLDGLAGRDVWVECARLGCAVNTPARIAAVGEDRSVRLEGGVSGTFIPHRESAAFAAGRGAAKGHLMHDGSQGPALLILL